jgi:hypothetical protein
MTFKAAERIRETSTTTGTGTYTLSGPPTGYQPWSSLGANNYGPISRPTARTGKSASASTRDA